MTVLERMEVQIKSIPSLGEDEVCHIAKTPSSPIATYCGGPFKCPSDAPMKVWNGEQTCDCGRRLCPECQALCRADM